MNSDSECEKNVKQEISMMKSAVKTRDTYLFYGLDGRYSGAHMHLIRN